MARAVPLATWSSAPGTVSSAISLQKRRRVGPWSAFTPRCNFLAFGRVTPLRADYTVGKMETFDWASLSDEELLERRISTLGLRLEDTALQSLIQQLYDELSAKGLVFHPPCTIGAVVFVRVGISAIFTPLFAA